MKFREGVEKMVWIVSCSGYAMKHNGSVGFAKSLNDILASHFPERLARVYLFGVSWVFRTMYKCLQPFLDPATSAKFVFVAEGSERTTMEPDFDLATLPQEFGGDIPYT